MKKDYLLTLDAGTTGVKCALFTKNGKAVYSDVIPYLTYFKQNGWAEQNPQEQLQCVIKSIQNALEIIPASRVAAMVFTGTMNGCIPIDKKGEALYPNIIHSDIRSHEQKETIESKISQKAFYQITGNRIDVHSGLPKYLWLKKHERDIYQKAAAFINIKDYFYGKFTDRVAVTDYSDASLCACLNIHQKTWAWDILQEVGIASDKMPILLESTDNQGRLNEQYSKITGLPKGLPVILGGGDGACAAHGARQHQPADGYMNIGSSAWISAMSEKPILDEQMRIFNYYDLDSEVYNVCGTLQSATAAFDWGMENLLGINKKEEGFSYDQIEEMAKKSPLGGKGLFFLPTMMGERTPWWTAEISGTLIGATLAHNRDDLARALYEGVMQGLHVCKQIFDENQLIIKKLVAIGGGAKSALWGQMASSMMGVPVRIHGNAHHATSLGAAFAAGVGIGLYKDFNDAAQYIQTDRTYHPIQSEQIFFQKQYEIYINLYPNMEKAYEKIYRFQQKYL